MNKTVKNRGLKTPSELAPKKTEKMPIATRITVEAGDIIERAAKAEGMTLGGLAAAVLEEYAEFLKGLK